MSPQLRSGKAMGRKMLAIGVAGVFAVWSGAQCQSAAAEDRLMLKAGISDPVNTVLAWYMAQDAGRFAAHGLDAEIINMNGGSRGAAELAAGRLDAMHVGLSSVIRVNRAGGDLRSIGSLSNVIRFTFFSAPGIKTAADLKGGVIGGGTFAPEKRFTRGPRPATLGARPKRCDSQGIRRRDAPARGGKIRRDQSHTAQRAA